MTQKKIVIEDALCFNLYAATRLMNQTYSEFLKEFQLTYPQFLVLNILWEKQQVSQTEIGERLYLDSGTLTPLIRRMINDELIYKEKNKLDGRESFLKLTKKGQQLQKKAEHIAGGMFCKLDVKLERFIEIRDGVRQIVVNLNESLKSKTKTKTNKSRN